MGLLACLLVFVCCFVVIVWVWIGDSLDLFWLGLGVRCFELLWVWFCLGLIGCVD